MHSRFFQNIWTTHWNNRSVLETKIPALNSSNTSKTEFTFKYTRNQKQCAFSDKVSQDISAIKTAIVADNRELAIKTVDKVQRDIVVRNKTVKTRDKHGWDTVNAYEGNPLADDERHLRQAETRAIHKRKAATQTYGDGEAFSWL
jgi:hypothetical protein